MEKHTLNEVSSYQHLNMGSNIVSSVKQYLKELVIANDSITFEDAISDENINSCDIIHACISALGEIQLSKSDSADSITFYSNSSPESSDKKLVFHKESSMIEGELAESIPKAFAIISAIENELTESSLYTQDLREKYLSRVLSKLSVSEELFNLVLRNW